MMSSTDWVGLSGLALVWLCAAMRLPVAQRQQGWRRWAYVAAVYVLVMLPLGGLSLAGWLRGMVGDLSMTSMLLLASALYARLAPASPPLWGERESAVLLGFLAAAALLLYPFALGLGAFDPYRLGYAGLGLLSLLAAVSLWALWRGRVLLPLAIALAAASWGMQVLESSNVWDYLIDAPLAIYALWVTAKASLLHVLRRDRA